MSNYDINLEKNKARNISSTDDMKGSYLGPQFSDEEINNELNKKDWSIDIRELSGHLFFNLYSDDITLSHEDGTLVYLPKASARIRLIPLLVGKIILNRLNVSNAEITPFFQTSSYSSTSEKINFYPEKFPSFLVTITKIKSNN